MIFETEQDLKRELKAITTFVSRFGGSFQKLDPNDIDYKVFDKDKKLIAYVEVKSVIKTMHSAYPLSVSAKKLVKLVDKRLNPVVIWSCEDGIMYGKAEKLKGDIKWGLDAPELIVFYDRQKDIKYVRFI